VKEGNNSKYLLTQFGATSPTYGGYHVTPRYPKLNNNK